mmetsp:Transcript_70056/g.194686  ORF Transcript_70056/g.194686 Transcript_70056/m.194686 type:complete len:229 (-) Transcript_70056:509-1195(-)
MPRSSDELDEFVRRQPMPRQETGGVNTHAPMDGRHAATSTHSRGCCGMVPMQPERPHATHRVGPGEEELGARRAVHKVLYEGQQVAKNLSVLHMRSVNGHVEAVRRQRHRTVIHQNRGSQLHRLGDIFFDGPQSRQQLAAPFASTDLVPQRWDYLVQFREDAPLWMRVDDRYGVVGPGKLPQTFVDPGPMVEMQSRACCSGDAGIFHARALGRRRPVSNPLNEVGKKP